MPYVQSHTSLRLHPRTARLRAALSAAAGAPVSRATVVGHLHLLWHWVLDYAPYGDLSTFSAGELAEAAEWPGDPQPFVNALVTAGFLVSEGERLTVHDWLDYAGEMLRRRQARAAARATATPPTPTLPRATVASTNHRRPQPQAQEPAGFAGIRALRQAAATHVPAKD